MRVSSRLPAIDCRARASPTSYEAPYVPDRIAGRRGPRVSGARGGAPGFASAGRSPRHTGGDETAKEPHAGADEDRSSPMRKIRRCGALAQVAVEDACTSKKPNPSSLAVARVVRGRPMRRRRARADGGAVVRTEASNGWATQLKAKDETTLMFTMRPSLACYHGGRVVFVAFAFEPLATMPPPLVAARACRGRKSNSELGYRAAEWTARRGRPPGSTKKKKEAALAAQEILVSRRRAACPRRAASIPRRAN